MLDPKQPTTEAPNDVEPGHGHVRAAREEKRSSAEAIGIDADYISGFVERFYARIREDEVLGPIFAERITDWDVHLDRMKGFWRSILHNTGEFKGNPMLKHQAIPGLDIAHFSRWLELFYATLREEEPDASATELVASRARMIADSLLTRIEMRRTGISGATNPSMQKSSQRLCAFGDQFRGYSGLSRD